MHAFTVLQSNVLLPFMVNKDYQCNRHVIEFIKLSMHVVLTVLLWRHCDMLGTSGLVKDVIFSHNGSYSVSCVFSKLRKDSVTAETAAT